MYLLTFSESRAVPLLIEIWSHFIRSSDAINKYINTVYKNPADLIAYQLVYDLTN